MIMLSDHHDQIEVHMISGIRVSGSSFRIIESKGDRPLNRTAIMEAIRLGHWEVGR
jgi:hypothetical protein